MRAALKHDADFLETREYNSAPADEKLKISETLSLSWNRDRPVVAKVQKHDVSVGSRTIELRTYTPENDLGDRYIVWVHGGGWNEGSLDIYDRLMRILAISAKSPVVGVGYTKAPHAQFPHQLTELLTAFKFAEAGLFPARPEKCIAGYSAGANLIMSTLKAYAENLGRGYFSRACLACGVFDHDLRSSTHIQYDGYFGNSIERLETIIENYAPGALARLDPNIFTANCSPLACQNYLIISAEHDMLRDDSEKLARTLHAGQNEVVYRCVPDVTHIFLQRSSAIKKAHETIVEMGRYLGK